MGIEFFITQIFQLLKYRSQIKIAKHIIELNE